MRANSEKNKRNVKNIIILVMLTLGIVFIWIMKKIGVEVIPNYIPEEDVYGIPFNIGFQFSVIFGMLGSLLLQSALYCMVFCQKQWKAFALVSGLWIYFTITPEVIVHNSATFCNIFMREHGLKRIYFREVFSNLRTVGYILLVIVALIGLYHWFVGTTINEVDKKKCLIRNLLSVIIGVAGLIILVLLTFTNGWYIGLCVVTSVVSIFVLNYLERYWARFDFLPRNTNYREIIDK